MPGMRPEAAQTRRLGAQGSCPVGHRHRHRSGGESECYCCRWYVQVEKSGMLILAKMPQYLPGAWRMTARRAGPPTARRLRADVPRVRWVADQQRCRVSQASLPYAVQFQ